MATTRRCCELRMPLLGVRAGSVPEVMQNA
jgi:hypothetical protein